jgi:NosR/NirI family nitrous oxide reductase transcriptional regulator
LIRRLIISTVLLAAFTALLSSQSLAQTPFSMIVQPEWLQEVLPQAESFSDKEPGEAPVYRGFRTNPDNGEQELVGFVFLTDDYPPERVGYAAPIDMLVGMNLEGIVTNMKVLDYYESYLYSRGDFINNTRFLSQFRNKPISDEFRLNRDVDGLSSATQTSVAMARGVGETARRVARAYLGYGEGTEAEQNSTANARALLEQLSWDDMLAQGIIAQLDSLNAEGNPLTLSFTYMGRQALGEHFIGANAFNATESDAAFRAGGGEIMLIMPSGPGAGTTYRQFPMSVQQDDLVRRVAGNRFSNAGNATEGAIVGHAPYAVAIAMHPDFDITRPFTMIYHTPGGRGDVRVDYTVQGVGLTLARNELVLSEEDLLQARLADAGFFTRLRLDPPWGLTPWIDVALLLGIFALVMGAFLSKNSPTRWVALTATLFYLGFYKSGFLSVSHITSIIKQGPLVISNNLTTLMIVGFTLITTLIWGRIFCSSMCPFGAVQDFIARFSPKNWRLKVPQRIHDQALYIKYGILGLIVVTAMVNANLSIFQYFEPFGTLFFFSPSLVLWSILIVILAACFVVERFYCRYVCPLGAALGIVSLLSPLRIKRVPQCSMCKVCEHACPTGAIRGATIDFKECVRCDVCEIKLINLAGTCRHTPEEIERRRKAKPTIPIIDLGAASSA